jgi:murein DD-endopeptidase MepM/ murein hydrolase activator NlpD
LFTSTVRPPRCSAAVATRTGAGLLGGEVGRQELGPAARGLDLLDDGGPAALVPAVHRDPGALGPELDGDGLADARRRAGHQRHLARQPHGPAFGHGPGFSIVPALSGRGGYALAPTVASETADASKRDDPAPVVPDDGGALPLVDPATPAWVPRVPRMLSVSSRVVSEPGVVGTRRARTRSHATRAVRVVVAMALVAGGLVGAAGGAAATPLDDAKAKVEESQRAADAAAARFEDAIGRYEELGARIEALHAQIAAGKSQAAALRVVARHRAAEAYTQRDVLDTGGFLVGRTRSTRFAGRSSSPAPRRGMTPPAAQLAALTDDLVRQRRDLEDARTRQAAVLESVQAEQEVVQRQLGEAQQALTALEEQLRKEEEAQRARDLAAAVARSASSRDNGRDYSGSFVATGLVCPVRGSVSFIDSWGAPRHQGAHQGVDLMAARGTPDVAVVPGNVTFRSGGTSGNGAYLRGDDGNLYYYFHLEGYEGGPRHVAQGEVIGYVGNTGDAQYTATHTHFEIHPGGGAAVNPYPSVRAVC